MDTASTILNENLEYLEKIHSNIPYKLMTVDPSSLEFCRSENKSLNLKRFYGDTTYYYHSEKSPVQESTEWFKNLDLHEITVLFVYGVGIGYYYDAAQAWLKRNSNHVLVFLEEDLGVVYRLLETEIGGRLIRDPQVDLVLFQDLVEDKTLFNELSWNYINCPYVISGLKLYQEVNEEGYSQLYHRVSFELNHKKAFVEEYFQYGIAFYRNFYPNLLKLPTSFSGNALFGNFKNTPAIICGAGPSLEKNIHLLQEYKDYALLFAGGSALNALIPKGIIPHFGTAIDPNDAQLSRIGVAASHKIPFFYRNRVSRQALDTIQGPRLYLTGTGGYDTADWFEEALGIQGDNLDEGHNVINLSIEIAHALGCHPIILVGLDLAFTNEKLYTDEVANNLNMHNNDVKSHGDPDSEIVMREDIEGKPVKTLWKWIAEAEWITEFSGRTPDATLINATEGGIGFKNVPNQPLKEVAEKYFKVKSDLTNRITLSIPQNNFSKIKTETLKELMRQLKDSLDRCIEIIDKIIMETNDLAHKIFTHLPYPEKLDTLSITLLENDIIEEPAYQYVLNTFNEIYIRTYLRDISNLQSLKRDIPKEMRDIGKVNLQKNRLSFLKDVAKVNRELIQQSL